MVLNQAQILLWLGHFLWPFLRITGLFLTAPFYGSAFIPGQVKAITAAAFAAALAMWLPGLPPFPADPISAIIDGIIQLSFGAVLGLAMQITLTGVTCAGEIVGLSIGLGFAELQFREASAVTPVLYDFMFWVALMGYIAVGGPVWMFAAIAHSFQSGIGVGNLGSWSALNNLGGTVITSAVWLALPVMAVALSINITVGLTTVFAPQMNLLTIGFPILVLVGLWIFLGSVGFVDHGIHRALSTAMDAISGIIANE
jgi:flagellar biosynthetic protein FliR